jgi:sulfonate transport system permease protein
MSSTPLSRFNGERHEPAGPPLAIELPTEAASSSRRLDRAPARLIQTSRLTRLVLRLLVPAIAVLIWQLTSSSASSRGFHLPAPGQVISGFQQLWANGSIQAAIPASLIRAGLGLGIGLIIGIFFGTLNGLLPLFEELFDSSFQIARVIPFIALVPLFVVWFGIGQEMKIILIALACVFPAYINTYAAVRLVDPKLIEAGRVFALRPIAITLTIILPAALPSILVGVRYAMAVALLALIVAEQVNANAGIGHIVYVAEAALRIDLMICGILIYAVLGLAADVLMRLIERYSTPWLDRSK